MNQLESGFNRTIGWNKYQSKIIEQTQNRYLDFLDVPSFQVVNRLFVLSFKDKNIRKSYKQYFISTIEIKNYSVMIDGKNFFGQLIKNGLRTYDNI